LELPERVCMVTEDGVWCTEAKYKLRYKSGHCGVHQGWDYLRESIVLSGEVREQRVTLKAGSCRNSMWN
jgi:hypothetical protein